MHKSDIIDAKAILIPSCQGALLAIEPRSLYYFISKDSNHVQGGINKITFLCTLYMFFALVLHYLRISPF
jgi:hypothetical protein